MSQKKRSFSSLSAHWGSAPSSDSSTSTIPHDTIPTHSSSSSISNFDMGSPHIKRARMSGDLSYPHPSYPPASMTSSSVPIYPPPPPVSSQYYGSGSAIPSPHLINGSFQSYPQSPLTPFIPDMTANMVPQSHSIVPSVASETISSSMAVDSNIDDSPGTVRTPSGFARTRADPPETSDADMLDDKTNSSLDSTSAASAKLSAGLSRRVCDDGSLSMNQMGVKEDDHHIQSESLKNMNHSDSHTHGNSSSVMAQRQQAWNCHAVSYKFEGPIKALSYSSDGKLCAAACAGGLLRVFDMNLPREWLCSQLNGGSWMFGDCLDSYSMSNPACSSTHRSSVGGSGSSSSSIANSNGSNSITNSMMTNGDVSGTLMNGGNSNLGGSYSSHSLSSLVSQGSSNFLSKRVIYAPKTGAPQVRMHPLYNTMATRLTINDLCFHTEWSSVQIAAPTSEGKVVLVTLDRELLSPFSKPIRLMRSVIDECFALRTLRFHPNNHFLFVGGDDSFVRMYDVSRLIVSDIQEPKFIPVALERAEKERRKKQKQKNPNGQGFIFRRRRRRGGGSGSMYTGSSDVESYTDRLITQLRVSQSGNLIVSANALGCITMYDGRTMSPVNRLDSAHSGLPIRQIELSHQISGLSDVSNELLSSGDDCTVKLWDLRTGKVRLHLDIGLNKRESRIWKDLNTELLSDSRLQSWFELATDVAAQTRDRRRLMNTVTGNSPLIVPSPLSESTLIRTRSASSSSDVRDSGGGAGGPSASLNDDDESEEEDEDDDDDDDQQHSHEDAAGSSSQSSSVMKMMEHKNSKRDDSMQSTLLSSLKSPSSMIPVSHVHSALPPSPHSHSALSDSRSAPSKTSLFQRPHPSPSLSSSSSMMRGKLIPAASQRMSQRRSGGSSSSSISSIHRPRLSSSMSKLKSQMNRTSVNSVRVKGTRAVFSYNDDVVVASDSGNRIMMFDSRNGERMGRARDHKYDVSAVTSHPSDLSFVTGSLDARMRVFYLNHGAHSDRDSERRRRFDFDSFHTKDMRDSINETMYEMNMLDKYDINEYDFDLECDTWAWYYSTKCQSTQIF